MFDRTGVDRFSKGGFFDQDIGGKCYQFSSETRRRTESSHNTVKVQWYEICNNLIRITEQNEIPVVWLGGVTNS